MKTDGKKIYCCDKDGNVTRHTVTMADSFRVWFTSMHGGDVCADLNSGGDFKSSVIKAYGWTKSDALCAMGHELRIAAIDMELGALKLRQAAEKVDIAARNSKRLEADEKA